MALFKYFTKRKYGGETKKTSIIVRVSRRASFVAIDICANIFSKKKMVVKKERGSPPRYVGSITLAGGGDGRGGLGCLTGVAAGGGAAVPFTFVFFFGRPLGFGVGAACTGAGATGAETAVMAVPLDELGVPTGDSELESEFDRGEGDAGKDAVDDSRSRDGTLDCEFGGTREGGVCNACKGNAE
jgi:hypothetical protein